jgi:5-methylcytosine-specific restriction endonuclease McrA
MAGEKRCKKCGLLKPLTDYGKKKNGLHSQCKACVSEYNRQWRNANREKRAEYNRRWHEQNRDHVRETQRRWRQEHPEKSREYRRRWRVKNPEYARQWRDKNIERLIERDRQWRKANRERKAINDRQWRLSNPQKRLAATQRRRARKAGNGGDFMPEQWERLCCFYNHCCLACGQQPEVLTVDHIVPLSLGGSNDISNLQPLCASCNSSKHDRVIDFRKTFYQQRELFEKENQEASDV